VRAGTWVATRRLPYRKLLQAGEGRLRTRCRRFDVAAARSPDHAHHGPGIRLILIETSMLDTRSKPPVLPVWEEADRQPKVAAKPSFGLGSLRRRKDLLVFSTIAFLTMGLLYAAYRPTTYTASSLLLVFIKQIQTGADLAILPGRADLPLVQNQIELLRSGHVLIKTVESLKLYNDAEFTDGENAAFSAALETLSRKLSVRQVGASHMITVAYKASEPVKAARVVNTVIRVYLQELVRASDAGSPALRELYQSLGPSAFLVSDAQPPIWRDGPPTVLIALGASLLGLCVGAAVAILRDAMNDTIRSARQVEYALGMECLGILSRRADKGIVAENATAERSRAAEGEELRRLSATMLEASLRDVRTIGVTSTVPGEGATTLAIGLAQAIAAAGKRVLLIDGVPYNRSVSRWAVNLSGTPVRSSNGPRPGLPDGIVEGQTGLHVLPFREPSDGKIYLTGPALPDGVLHNAVGSYDIVIVDLPALVTGPDVRAAAQSLDGLLIVVKWGATESELVRQALRSAGEARPKFVGAVLNMADDDTMRRYVYELGAELKVATAS
jgi:succinoglycan biosynthesis transport protein ExoP